MPFPRICPLQTVKTISKQRAWKAKKSLRPTYQTAIMLPSFPLDAFFGSAVFLAMFNAWKELRLKCLRIFLRRTPGNCKHWEQIIPGLF